MTRYVGERYPRVIFTGFNIWSFARVDCKDLVDAVLQDMWHLSYTPPPVAAVPTASGTDLRSRPGYALGTVPDGPVQRGGPRARRER